MTIEKPTYEEFENALETAKKYLEDKDLTDEDNKLEITLYWLIRYFKDL
jgi:hypothetical protein